MKDKIIHEFNSFIELVNYFDSEQKCKQYLANMRWDSIVVCPYCNHDRCYVLQGKNKRFKCSACRRHFSVRVGTIFEDSKISLRKWFFAVYLFTAHEKGVSSYQLSRDIKVTQKSAWYMLQRIREGFSYDEASNMTGEIEADEAFIGGKELNKHKSKRDPKAKSNNNKIPVLGVMQRNGKIYATPIPNTKLGSLYPVITSKVKPGSKLYTDEWQAYKFFKNDYIHEAINHTQDEFVRGDVHTQNIENFWSMLKRGIIGIYHHVSIEHLHRYVNEFVYRFNNRQILDNQPFDGYMGNAVKRISYKELIEVK